MHCHELSPTRRARHTMSRARRTGGYGADQGGGNATPPASLAAQTDTDRHSHSHSHTHTHTHTHAHTHMDYRYLRSIPDITRK